MILAYTERELFVSRQALRRALEEFLFGFRTKKSKPASLEITWHCPRCLRQKTLAYSGDLISALQRSHRIESGGKCRFDAESVRISRHPAV